MRTGHRHRQAINAPRPARCSPPAPWRALPHPATNRKPGSALGYAIGEAFQVADDLRDVAGSAQDLGKPIGQDESNHCPNAVAALGFDGAMRRFDDLLATALAAIPPCPGAEPLGLQITAVSRSLVTGLSARHAA